VNEVQQVRRRGPQAFDPDGIKLPNLAEERLFGATVAARAQETAERELVLARLIDVRDAQLRFHRNA